jgi:hypothetical protein
MILIYFYYITIFRTFLTQFFPFFGIYFALFYMATPRSNPDAIKSFSMGEERKLLHTELMSLIDLIKKRNVKIAQLEKIIKDFDETKDGVRNFN